MTSLMAYPLSKTFLWGNKFFTKMVVVTMFFSGGLIPNYLLLNSLHPVSSTHLDVSKRQLHNGKGRGGNFHSGAGHASGAVERAKTHGLSG